MHIALNSFQPKRETLVRMNQGLSFGLETILVFPVQESSEKYLKILLLSPAILLNGSRKPVIER
jgi:hypothetical protein